MKGDAVPTKDLIRDLKVISNQISHEYDGISYLLDLSSNRLAELEKFSCGLVAQNAGLKNEIDRLKTAFNALTSQESLDVAFKGYVDCHMILHTRSPHACNNCMREAISAARKYVLEGKS